MKSLLLLKALKLLAICLLCFGLFYGLALLLESKI